AELAGRSPAVRVAALAQRIAHAGARLPGALRHRIAVMNGRLGSVARGLHATSPLATLARGYAIVTLADGGRIVTDAASVAPGTEVDARLARGRLRARVIAAGD
ncbi:MAG: exodeoxyribonuclease VII large subunit, partial [Steroidobacteraceae bacterium]